MAPTPLPSYRPRPFRLAAWAADPHLQTLGARVLRPRGGLEMVRERWELDDGDFLDVDVGPEPLPGPVEAPLALVLHGLEGSSTRRYVRSMCRELQVRGVRPFAMNFRGCSGALNRRPRLYHSGETGDPAFILQALRRAFPGRKVGAVGFSLGGNVLLKLLGEREDGGRGLVDAAVGISVPMDLAAGGRLLEETVMGRLYSQYFLRSLQKKVQARTAILDGRVDVAGVMAAKTLRAFDDAATAPLHGFRDARHYYAECSSAAYLAGIGTPTLVLHAMDDPFLPPDAVPVKDLDDNPAITPVLTRHGGHVGFLEGSPWRPRFWAEEEGAAFLAAHLGARAPQRS